MVRIIYFRWLSLVPSEMKLAKDLKLKRRFGWSAIDKSKTQNKFRHLESQMTILLVCSVTTWSFNRQHLKYHPDFYFYGPLYLPIKLADRNQVSPKCTRYCCSVTCDHIRIANNKPSHFEYFDFHLRVCSNSRDMNYPSKPSPNLTLSLSLPLLDNECVVIATHHFVAISLFEWNWR